MTRVAQIIPFRDRGIDPLRKANLECVVRHWGSHGGSYQSTALVISDGRTGDEQFNRSAAYNRGVRHAPHEEAYVFAESDMLVDADQIDQAVSAALEAPGLVIPFTEYRYLSAADSARVRAGEAPENVAPQWTMDDGRSIGAINVVSRATMALIGQWDEQFQGSWYDDDAMARAFDVAAGPTRWIDGPAHHLYHLPGWKGAHLTAADRAATAHNRQRLDLYRRAQTPQRIRQLTSGV